jgi:hypothetical protein
MSGSRRICLNYYCFERSGSFIPESSIFRYVLYGKFNPPETSTSVPLTSNNGMLTPNSI